MRQREMLLRGMWIGRGLDSSAMDEVVSNCENFLICLSTSSTIAECGFNDRDATVNGRFIVLQIAGVSNRQDLVDMELLVSGLFLTPQPMYE